MQSILEDIVKEHLEIQSSDIIVFFKVAEFVTSFQYHKCITTKVRHNKRDKMPNYHLHSVTMV